MEVPTAFARRCYGATDSRSPQRVRGAWTVSLAASSSSGLQTLRPRLMRASASLVKFVGDGVFAVLIAASRRMDSQAWFCVR